MVTLDFKTDRQKDEWESGTVNLKLIKIVELSMRWIGLVHPDYKVLTITDIIRSQEEQDDIYTNHTDLETRAKYIEDPWPSVHQYGRGIDIRTYDMDKILIYELTNFYNTIPYDRKRPNKKTAIYHDAGTGSHCHLQVTHNG